MNPVSELDDRCFDGRVERGVRPVPAHFVWLHSAGAVPSSIELRIAAPIDCYVTQFLDFLLCLLLRV